ncbi:MAG TPA: serine/threonine-protein kinase [Chloroflexota bacterium]|nr:serine/threonine-protein kinase [Chloroflexota bacterium]
MALPTRPPRVDDLAGQCLGQYQLAELIGRGGMAVVYKALQPSLHRYVAVKVLSPYLMQEEEFRTRFQREAETVARLDHPNILPVYDYGQQDDLAYIVMPLVTGGTLGDWLAQAPPLARIVPVLSQTLSALQHAHTREPPIVHRDVKPNNILMREHDWPLLADFGLAKILEPALHATQTGTIVGTPEYMAPELSQGGVVDARTDLYAMGIILFQVLTGRLPFEGPNPLMVLLQHVEGAVPEPRSLNPALSPAWDEVIRRSLAKDPADRYPSAEAMDAAIQAAWRQAQREAPTGEAATPTAALAAGRLADARRYYEEALRLAPGLAAAEAGLEPVRPAAPAGRAGAAPAAPPTEAPTGTARLAPTGALSAPTTGATREARTAPARPAPAAPLRQPPAPAPAGVPPPAAPPPGWGYWRVVALVALLLIGALAGLRWLGGGLGSPPSAAATPSVPPATPAPSATTAPTATPAPSAATLFPACEAAVGAADWAAAAAACEAVRALDAAYPGLASALAATYLALGQEQLAHGGPVEQALAYFEQALAAQPDDPVVAEARDRAAAYLDGAAALDAGNWPLAATKLGSVYAAAPDYLAGSPTGGVKARLYEARLGWGQALLDAGSYAEAQRRCEQALALAPDDPAAMACRAAAVAALATPTPQPPPVAAPPAPPRAAPTAAPVRPAAPAPAPQPARPPAPAPQPAPPAGGKPEFTPRY